MYKAYKYRLMPTENQATLINKHIGCCRFVYNLALEVKRNAYNSHRKNISSYDLIGQLQGLKTDCDWLNEVDSQALQQSIVNLGSAFNQFFSGKSSFPKYKNKHTGTSFRNPHGKSVKIKDSKLYQTKFRDGIKIIIDRPFNGSICNTTISKTPTGKYFVSILVESMEDNPPKKPIRECSTVGIDLGVKSFIVTSTGIKIDRNYILINPKIM